MPALGGAAMFDPAPKKPENLEMLRLAADPWAPFPQQASLARRLKRIMPSIADLRTQRIALLGNGTLDHFAEILVLWLTLEGFRGDIHVAPYGAFRQEILDPQSELYKFKPDLVWLFSTERDLAAIPANFGAQAEACDSAVVDVTAEWRNLWQRLRANTSALILQNNLEAPEIRVLGNYEGAVPWSRANLIRRVNLALADAAQDAKVALFDLDYAASLFGLQHWHEDRLWYQSKQPFAPDAFGLVAFQATKVIGALKGRARKCVVVDLDDTLWGGVVGDDGLAGIRVGDGPEGDAFVAFQEYLKSLQARGILLAVCSKNEEGVAKEPFLNHPSMRLRLDDFVVFKCNWRSKVENIRDIAASLNIGLESLVFVDDNPVERDFVRSLLPGVAVPEMPTDPAEYVRVLAAGHYFETSSVSQEDIGRTRLYKENALREAAMGTATDINDFLRGLQMEADIGPPDDFRLPRMTQLLARTNQFHPTTTRYSEAELQELAADPRSWVRWISLRDRFGDHGIVSVVVLRPEDDALLIDTWAMSCRVFSRGLEELVFLEMIKSARSLGGRYLIGHYYPTSKNLPVVDLFERLGFSRDGVESGSERWRLDLMEFVPGLAPFIQWKNQEGIDG